MSDTNNLVLIGRLTKTPELKATNKGTSICVLSLAVNKKHGQDEYVSFFDCNMWGKMAESLHPHLTQGLQVCITGELKQNRWEKDGQKRSKIEINVKEFQFLQRPNSSGSPQLAPQQPFNNPNFEDDIPF